ncbi:uncharacterized WD repeat-containing protein C343.04c-like [Chenopodium quinoa]|uniref:uncharacterized WD repeat-containing protein C343.04c-like n=1 Tax=Chenopodium quinoa TaxID=63459 RepID=UPI000B775441|nr:uncharacterized WD repeat-containing protein C343.04c-like [Chenopodium quinoa]
MPRIAEVLYSGSISLVDSKGYRIMLTLKSGRVCLKHLLAGHNKLVCTVSWSPDDSQLLTCGLEEVVRRWDVQSGKCLHVYENLGTALVSCGWFPDGKGVFCGATDKSICIWYLDGREEECWRGHRTLQTSEMAITNDGKSLLSLCQDSAIVFLDRQAKFERLIEEDQAITSFSLSKDSKFLLVNLANEEIHLWSLEGDFKVICTNKGHKRSRFVVRSCFGGIEQGFIASGSEDSQVYIWHRSTGELLLTLPGHSGAVNCHQESLAATPLSAIITVKCKLWNYLHLTSTIAHVDPLIF